MISRISSHSKIASPELSSSKPIETFAAASASRNPEREPPVQASPPSWYHQDSFERDESRGPQKEKGSNFRAFARES